MSKEKHKTEKIFVLLIQSIRRPEIKKSEFVFSTKCILYVSPDLTLECPVKVANMRCIVTK